MDILSFQAAPTAREGVPAHAPLEASEAVLRHLRRGAALTYHQLSRLMTSAFGGTDAEGAWDPRIAYDCAEAALARLVASHGAEPGNPAATLERLQDLEARLPAQTRRTIDTDALQQFSTPLRLGFLMTRIAGPLPDDHVLEPSAGTGLLAAHARGRCRTVTVNEISESRRTLLSAAHDEVSGHDARYIDALLARRSVPTAVLMNPPFSADPNKPGRQDRRAGADHLAAAFARLAPGGRLVALLGAGADPAEILRRLEVRSLPATLRADLPVHAGAFARQGTGVRTRILAIDKCRDRSPALVHELTGHNWAGIIAAIDAIPPRGTTRIARPTIAVPAPAATPPRVIPPKPAGPVARPATEAAEPIAYEVIAPSDRAPATDALFEPYFPQRVRIPGAQPHPTPLVETTALASIVPPEPHYRPMLPPGLVSSGRLSDVQLEILIQAGQAHETIFDDDPDGPSSQRPGTVREPVPTRRGFFLGAGTGSGKGATVAGIILDHWCRGRRKAIWLSQSKALYQDAARDWTWLGRSGLDLFDLDTYPPDKAIRRSDGILFTRYSTLRSVSRSTGRSRVDQIADWLGPGFDGVLILDEAHNMSSALGEKGEFGDRSASLQAQAGLDLQRRLPLARVVYVSATGASRLAALAYAPRLGLWGPGTPFPSRDSFIATIGTGGLRALELVAHNLKLMGLYAAYGLSMDGVEFEPLPHVLTPEQRRIYHDFCDAYQVALRALDTALEAARVTREGVALNRAARLAARSAFFGVMQRVYLQILVAMKTPAMIADIREQLAQGRSCVIQLTATNEAIMDRALATQEDEDLDLLDMTPKEALTDYVERCFPTVQQVEFKDPEGNLRSKPLLDDNGNSVHNPEALRAKAGLLDRLAAVTLPKGPLDLLLDAFGPEAVAEITGRKRRLVLRRENGRLSRVVEKRPANANVAETDAFQRGDKRILVFSAAGGTGRSYHADRSQANQQRRVHYLLDGGWRSDQALQGLGRTHRTNQACAPVYRPVFTDLPAEKRFRSTICRRLAELGAITRGQRDAAGAGLFEERDNYETPWASEAVEHLLDTIAAGRFEGLTATAFESMTGLTPVRTETAARSARPTPVTQFMNRMLALHIPLQERIYGALDATIDRIIEQHRKQGRYDAGIQTLRAVSLTVASRTVVHTDAATRASTVLMALTRTRHATRIDWTEVVDAGGQPVRNGRSDHVAIMHPWGVRIDELGIERPRIMLTRPSGRATIDAEDFKTSHWAPVSLTEAANLWRDEYDAISSLRTDTVHVLSGLILPVWNRLPTDTRDIVRAAADDGERILGLIVVPEAVPALLQAFGVQRNACIPALPDLIQALLAGRCRLALADGWSIRSSRVNGADRIELLPAGTDAALLAELHRLGCQVERHNLRVRIYLPTATAAELLAVIVATRPIADIL